MLAIAFTSTVATVQHSSEPQPEAGKEPPAESGVD